MQSRAMLAPQEREGEPERLTTAFDSQSSLGTISVPFLIELSLQGQKYITVNVICFFARSPDI